MMERDISTMIGSIQYDHVGAAHVYVENPLARRRAAAPCSLQKPCSIWMLSSDNQASSQRSSKPTYLHPDAFDGLGQLRG